MLCDEQEASSICQSAQKASSSMVPMLQSCVKLNFAPSLSSCGTKATKRDVKSVARSARSESHLVSSSAHGLPGIVRG